MEAGLKAAGEARSAQVDRFVHERLPPSGEWPRLLLPDEFASSVPLNCVDRLVDEHVRAGRAERPALISSHGTITYGELHHMIGRMAHVLVDDFGIVPGNRVLLRAPNSPTLAALWLAVLRTGAVAVTTMSLLRAAELGTIIDMARPALAVCDADLAGELEAALAASGSECALVTFSASGGELAERMRRHVPTFPPCPTASDDVALIGFTSGTTGRPKATIHFHRDVIAICETTARHVIRPAHDDIFIGTSPLAFTFGLGGLVIFPLWAGAASVLEPRYGAESLVEAIGRHRASVCFTVPTFYQRMVAAVSPRSAASLRLAVSSGEALPVPVREAWREVSGVGLSELLGSTEMLHAFVGAVADEAKCGYIGRAIPGYRVAVLDPDGRALPAGETGALAVVGPTGCRYLDDPRQRDYVRFGWNVTGDACAIDEEGYVAYHCRFDDMIISAGYNISAAEVENVVLEHPDVAECAVIGTPDPERGEVVTAYVVPRYRTNEEDVFADGIRLHVRERLAPYKYPRKVFVVSKLPRNESGKLQRFRLRSA